MHTLDTPQAASWRRDLRLLLGIAGMLAGYVVAGGRVRRLYRRKQRRGEVLFLDEEGPTRHREAPLAR
jgi:hypothetical protein